MSTANAQSPDSGRQPKKRPQSTLAQNFSAALDDLFKLNGIDALKESVEQKKDTVMSQRNELEDLETKLRETDAKLKRLEASHRRQQSQQIYSKRKTVASPTFVRSDNETDEDSSGDSEPQQNQSPPQRRGQEKR